MLHNGCRPPKAFDDLNEYGSKDAKTINVARATYSLFFKKFKNNIFKFKKKLKLNVNMYNVEIYKRAKIQLKIRYNLGYAK
jgi:hypothetical protein